MESSANTRHREGEVKLDRLLLTTSTGYATHLLRSSKRYNPKACTPSSMMAPKLYGVLHGQDATSVTLTAASNIARSVALAA